MSCVPYNVHKQHLMCRAEASAIFRLTRQAFTNAVQSNRLSPPVKIKGRNWWLTDELQKLWGHRI